MGNHSNHLLPFIIAIETQIQMNPEKLDLDIILETEYKLCTIVSQLKFIRNSRTPINKLIPDILYNIFTYAVDTDERYYSPPEIALAISHVCQHWRKSALGWPTLWRFIDLNNTRKNTELFLRRSKDTPLHLHTDPFNDIKTMANLELCADVISTRLRYLTLQLRSPWQLVWIQSAFHNPALQPLQLRHLTMKLTGQGIFDMPETIPLLPDIIRLDILYLRNLSLEGMELPWPTGLPHNNVLTRFIFRPKHLPLLSQLLDFLSSCHLLRELELNIVFYSSETEMPEITTTINRLDFPKLERLVLESSSHDGYMFPDMSPINYMREFSVGIRTMGLLSYFKLCYADCSWPDTTSTDTVFSPSNIFGLVPKETFFHFTDQTYLSIELTRTTSQCANFRIISAREPRSTEFDWESLYLAGSWGPGQLFRNALFELIYVMPRITYLHLKSAAVKSLVSWNLDFTNAFPCLDTLELQATGSRDDMNKMLKLLPTDSMEIKSLTLEYHRPISPQVLLDAVQKARVEVLTLVHHFIEEEFNDFKEVISTLRQTGVVVSTSHIY